MRQPPEVSSPTPPNRSLSRWWYQHTEPVVLTALVWFLFTLPVLVLLDVIVLQLALQAALVVGWLAGGIMLVRLPRLLQVQQRRTALLAGIGLAAMVLVLVVPSKPTTEAAQGGLTFQSAPRISRDGFISVLQRGTGGGPSPAAPVGGELYDIIVAYGMDPAVALAFFAHESQLCTVGMCAQENARNWGAQRRAVNGDRVEGIVPGRSGTFVRYVSWQASVRDWCELILYRYVNQGLDTVEKAIPVYAPSSDGNVPTSYIGAIRRMVSVWGGPLPAPAVAAAPPANLPRSYQSSIEDALLQETFLAAGITYHPTWAFHKYMLSEAQVGRPLGAPVGDSRIILVNGKAMAVQTFALDTLYTPLADVAEETNWSDVRRLSELLLQQGQPPQSTATPQSPTLTATPSSFSGSSAQP